MHGLKRIGIDALEASEAGVAPAVGIEPGDEESADAQPDRDHDRGPRLPKVDRVIQDENRERRRSAEHDDSEPA